MVRESQKACQARSRRKSSPASPAWIGKIASFPEKKSHAVTLLQAARLLTRQASSGGELNICVAPGRGGDYEMTL
jgi:hypothetical protein